MTKSKVKECRCKDCIQEFKNGQFHCSGVKICPCHSTPAPNEEKCACKGDLPKENHVHTRTHCYRYPQDEDFTDTPKDWEGELRALGEIYNDGEYEEIINKIKVNLKQVERESKESEKTFWDNYYAKEIEIRLKQACQEGYIRGFKEGQKDISVENVYTYEAGYISGRQETIREIISKLADYSGEYRMEAIVNYLLSLLQSNEEQQ